MPAVHDSLLERITTDPEVRFGKPCIRGHRITVQEILEWLSSGASQQQILADFPRSEEHTSELQSLRHLVCRLLLEKKKHTVQMLNDNTGTGWHRHLFVSDTSR